MLCELSSWQLCVCVWGNDTIKTRLPIFKVYFKHTQRYKENTENKTIQTNSKPQRTSGLHASSMRLVKHFKIHIWKQGKASSFLILLLGVHLWPDWKWGLGKCSLPRHRPVNYSPLLKLYAELETKYQNSKCFLGSIIVEASRLKEMNCEWVLYGFPLEIYLTLIQVSNPCD